MEHHPIKSNSLLTLTLWVVGDSLAQYSEYKHLNKAKQPEQDLSLPSSSFLKFLDVQRTAQCAGFGALVTGPVYAMWFPFLDRMCHRWRLAARYGVWGAPIAKVLADEFLLDPPCLCVFFGWMNICEGGNLESYKHKLQTQFLPSWTASLLVWPIILLGTFRFVPLHLQAPIVNTCCIVWDGFLSHRNTLSKASNRETPSNIQTRDSKMTKEAPRLEERSGIKG